MPRESRLLRSLPRTLACGTWIHSDERASPSSRPIRPSDAGGSQSKRPGNGDGFVQYYEISAGRRRHVLQVDRTYPSFAADRSSHDRRPCDHAHTKASYAATAIQTRSKASGCKHCETQGGPLEGATKFRRPLHPRAVFRFAEGGKLLVATVSHHFVRRNKISSTTTCVK